ncbi:MAG: D-alanine--D-alanine ligase [Planctomycetes bacterium]|nr:D-alanine--D-alanine ligase [Planctomycetota bacterium]
MADKLNVAVLMGGKSAEHRVSLSSGQVVLEYLDRRKYNVKPICITQRGQWLIAPGYVNEVEGNGDPRGQLLFGFSQERKPAALDTGLALSQTVAEKVDVVFIAMHGPYGEDGTIQGLLEILDIPYTGSNVAASALAMDKVRCKEVIAYNGIQTPKYVASDAHKWKRHQKTIVERIESELGYPCVVKTRRMGSSVGVNVVKDRAELVAFVTKIIRYDPDFFAEEYIQGTEITCSVLGSLPGESPVALPLTEIVPRTATWFDYDAKYTPGATEEITPARLPADLTAEAQEIAVRVHEILDCGGLSRTDIIMRDGRLFVLETNTIPGMTRTSLFPQAARAAGISMSDLLDKLIYLAIEGHRRKKYYAIEN